MPNKDVPRTCEHCGVDLEAGRQRFCASCAETRKQASIRRHRLLKAAQKKKETSRKKCIVCGGQKPPQNKKYCENCAKQKKLDHIHAQSRQRTEKRHTEEPRLCPECGGPLEDYRKNICYACEQELGKCLMCNDPLKPDSTHRYCSYCEPIANLIIRRRDARHAQAQIPRDEYLAGNYKTRLLCFWCLGDISRMRVNKYIRANPPRYCCRQHAAKELREERILNGFFFQFSKKGIQKQQAIKQETGERPGESKRRANMRAMHANRHEGGRLEHETLVEEFIPRGKSEHNIIDNNAQG